MEDPATEIPVVIRLVAGARTADLQAAAFERYFTRDPGFLHPLCHIRPAFDSRRWMIRIYQFYRIVIAEAEFRIRSVAYDSQQLVLSVDLVETAHVRWTPFKPEIPILSIFRLRQSHADGLYYIAYQEDYMQPALVLPAVLPPLAPLFNIFYSICVLLGLANARLLQRLFGVWEPSKKP